MIFPWGPLVNAIIVIMGSLIGVSVGRLLPDRIRTIVFQGLGLCTLMLGMQMAVATKAPLVIILSVLLGGVCGEFLKLEDKFLGLGDKIRKKIGAKNPKFTDGFVNASILFCIGALAILGSIEEGVKGDRTIVFTKSIMDFFAAIALSSAYGIGVAFSAVMIFLYQGLIVVFASQLQAFINPGLLAELSALGGVLVLGISLNLLNLLQIRLSNFLPALILLVLLYPLHAMLGL